MEPCCQNKYKMGIGMKAFHMNRDSVRLYFTNYENRPDDEEFEEIMSILKENNCRIGETLMEPDCDLIHCSVQSVRFDVIRTIDGDGSFIYCDNSDGMRFIENMFEMK